MLLLSRVPGYLPFGCPRLSAWVNRPPKHPPGSKAYRKCHAKSMGAWVVRFGGAARPICLLLAPVRRASLIVYIVFGVCEWLCSWSVFGKPR